jgi:CheY-like chemotaxis protein
MSTRGPVRIVVIEDNQADVFLIDQSLRLRGIDFELVHFASGDEALLHLCRASDLPLEPPDLILLDLHLPGTDGHQVLRALREEPRLTKVPIAVLSGADPGFLRRIDLSGSTRLLRKSMDLDTYQNEVGDSVLEILFPGETVPGRNHGGADEAKVASLQTGTE